MFVCSAGLPENPHIRAAVSWACGMTSQIFGHSPSSLAHIFWWFQALWKMMEFVSWDDYSQYMEKWKMFQNVPNHQPVFLMTLRTATHVHPCPPMSHSPAPKSPLRLRLLGRRGAFSPNSGASSDEKSWTQFEDRHFQKNATTSMVGSRNGGTPIAG